MAAGPVPPPFPAVPPLLPDLSIGFSTGGRWRAALALAPLALLGGCFSAEQDLIGAHAVAPVRLGSLVTLNGYPYRIDRTTEGVFGCELRLKTDDAAGCWERYRLAFERTARGNLVVEAIAVDAKFVDEGKAVFLLAERTPAGDYDCFYLLGATDDGTPEPVQDAQKAIIARFGKDLIDRKALLEIVDAYERTVLPLNPQCPGNKLVVVEPSDLGFADEPTPTPTPTP